jgi:hypothetical protein
MAGVIITGGKPPRIARVETGSERPAWIGDTAKLDEEKKQCNRINANGGEDLEMCDQVAYYLIAKYLRKKLKKLNQGGKMNLKEKITQAGQARYLVDAPARWSGAIIANLNHGLTEALQEPVPHLNFKPIRRTNYALPSLQQR